MKKIVLLAFVLVLLSTAVVVRFIRPVEASGSITINADGSVEPDTAPISSDDNITYTFTGNINETIAVKRGNIVIDGAGYSLIGDGIEYGIDVSDINNVTIRNTEIKTFQNAIWFYFSSGHSVYGNNITNNYYGIILWSPVMNTVIYGNNIAANNVGIRCVSSPYNTICRNNIKNNNVGIYLAGVYYNSIYHNNFINNTNQIGIQESPDNSWDNGYPSGGNYWSDYKEVDLDHDGIGDTKYTIDASNTDNFPLMGMFHSFNISLGYYVNVISNSTLEDFTFFESNSTIRMYISNMTVNQAFGFCRVCIPKNLMSPPYTVIINDGMTDVLHFNSTVHENYTHKWIYFAYEHSTHIVVIVPEFPTWTSMLLPLIVLTVAIIIYKRRLLKTSTH